MMSENKSQEVKKTFEPGDIIVCSLQPAKSKAKMCVEFSRIRQGPASKFDNHTPIMQEVGFK